METGSLQSSLMGLSFAAAALLAAVHIFSQKLRLLDGIPRSRLLSVVGGMAVAFVILRLLPAIAGHQQTLAQAAQGTPLAFLNNHVYVVLLGKLGALLWLGAAGEAFARKNQEVGGADQTTAWVFWVHMSTFALMNVLIGYMLVNHAETDKGIAFLLLFSAAMFFKFLVNDHGLHSAHKERYDHIGRWLLTGAVFVGWGVNYFIDLPKVAPALLQSFIAGGVLLNVLKEELPAERKSRYWAFLLGATAYPVLLLSF